NLVAGVNVFVCDDMNLGGGNDVKPTSLTASQVSWEVHSTDTHNAFVCGGGCDWIGDIFAPAGGIHLGSGGSAARFKGPLFAQFVDLEHGVIGVPPQTPLTHLTLKKAVDNTGGGTAQKTDWTLTATGSPTISGPDGDPAVTGVVVNPGTFTLSESGGPTNY